MYGYIYKTINLSNGKIYIGITNMSVNRRWRNNGEGYKGQFVYRAIKKYGWENVKHEVLFENLTQQEAEQKEIELIAFYKSNQIEFGYNLAKGAMEGASGGFLEAVTGGVKAASGGITVAIAWGYIIALTFSPKSVR